MLEIIIFLFFHHKLFKSQTELLGVIKQERIFDIDSDLTKCKNSIFSNSRAIDANGGAIYSNTNIYIESSRFTNCFAKHGGAIHGSKTTILISNIFENCNAEVTHGAFMHAGEYPSLNCTLNLFSMGKAQVFAGFSFNDGPSNIIASNFSRCTANYATSSFELGTTINSSISYIINFNQSNPQKNAGCSFWQCKNFLLKKSLFMWLSIFLWDQANMSSIAIWLDGETLTGKITECSFLYCKSTCPYIPIIKCYQCNSVSIQNSCFTSPKEDSISGSISIGKNNKFGLLQTCLEINPVPKGDEIGFNRNNSIAYKTLEKKNLIINKILEIDQMKRIVIYCTCCLLLILIILERKCKFRKSLFKKHYRSRRNE